ncbi:MULTISPECIES: hypothetical protein [Sorangium]|uniref:hypothetical protein n=1 Tax=Sorangium TaxID=39643 RepID=UPI003D9C22C5
MNIALATTASILRRLALAAAPVLACALPLACIAGQEGVPEEEETLGESVEALTDWSSPSWGTTRDLIGVPINPINWSCALRGIAGNLSEGTYPSSPGVQSTARVWRDPNQFGGVEMLIGHGGANVVNGARVWVDNPVNAHATCFPTAASLIEATWSSTDPHFPPAPPLKIADLDPNGRRHCFLSGVMSGTAHWENDTDFARVRKITFPSGDFPTTGWYIDSNLRSSLFGGVVKVEAKCMTFPQGTVFTEDELASDPGSTRTEPITFTSGIKACALIGIRGAFNQNSWVDGAVIEPPGPKNGNWNLTVTNGKKAWWACAE